MRFRLVHHGPGPDPLITVATDSRKEGFAVALRYFRRTFLWLMVAGPWKVYLEDDDGKRLAYTPPGSFKLVEGA